jgi:hypothetical protein
MLEHHGEVETGGEVVDISVREFKIVDESLADSTDSLFIGQWAG